MTTITSVDKFSVDSHNEKACFLLLQPTKGAGIDKIMPEVKELIPEDVLDDALQKRHLESKWDGDKKLDSYLGEKSGNSKVMFAIAYDSDIEAPNAEGKNAEQKSGEANVKVKASQFLDFSIHVYKLLEKAIEQGIEVTHFIIPVTGPGVLTEVEKKDAIESGVSNFIRNYPEKANSLTFELVTQAEVSKESDAPEEPSMKSSISRTMTNKQFFSLWHGIGPDPEMNKQHQKMADYVKSGQMANVASSAHSGSDRQR